MSETPRSNVGPERICIDLEADWEVSYWTRKLGITRAQLAQAIEAVGDKAHDIVVYFRQLELQGNREGKKDVASHLEIVAH